MKTMTVIHDGKHMDIMMRRTIREMLTDGHSLKEISHEIGKDERTIAKEIKKHRELMSLEGRRKFNKANIDKMEPCKKIIRFPYTCNGCPRKKYCILDHYYYNPDEAQKSYEYVLSSCRQGINMTKSEFDLLDKTIKDGTLLGQSIYAICQNNPDKIKCSSRNIYNYVDKNILQTKSIDLRRKVKFKVRKKYDYKKTIKDKYFIKNREITDYFKFILENNIISPIQLDTVEGNKECKKVLLTIHFVTFHFMMIFVIDSQSPDEVTKVFNWIQNQIGIDNFKLLFPCILCDRGKEFVNPLDIEFDPNGEHRTNIFFCDAYVSNQKGAIESNHRLLRYIIPKYSNTDILLPSHSLLCMNNIASYPRKELSGKTPYDVMSIYYPKDILDKLLIKKIDPNQVNLTPTLLIK